MVSRSSRQKATCACCTLSGLPPPLRDVPDRRLAQTSCSDGTKLAARWLAIGAPAGILEHRINVGIFVTSVEDDDLAWNEVQRLVQKDLLKESSDLNKGKRLLKGDTPVVSKFGLVIKGRQDPAARHLGCEGEQNHGLRSQERAFHLARSNRHRLRHAPCTQRIAELTEHGAVGDGPGLRDSERKFFVGKLRGTFSFRTYLTSPMSRIVPVTTLGLLQVRSEVLRVLRVLHKAGRNGQHR